MKSAAIVVNPIAGSPAQKRAVERFRERLRRLDVSSTVRETQAAGDGARLAEEAAAEGVDLVVAAGGDGTVNEVARGLMAADGTHARLAILPRGTSNLVARELGVPLDPCGAADVAAGGVPGAMDVAEADGRPFLACAGIGWDAAVVAGLHGRRKGHIRMSTYARPMWRALMDYDHPPMRVTDADGRTVEGVLTLILNSRPYAAYLRPIPDADPHDGLLDAVVLHSGRRRDLLAYAFAALRGRLAEHRQATRLRSTSFRIEAEAEVPVQLDGDVGGHTPVDILVRPGALRVVRPGPS